GAVGRSDVVNRGVAYLTSVRNADGGWGNGLGGESRVQTTTAVADALLALGHAEAAEPALQWLQASQRADGGFGDESSTVHDTANVFDLFITADASERLRVEALATYLIQSQRQDGSWDSSIYATAVTLAVLDRYRFHNWRIRSFSAEPLAP